VTATRVTAGAGGTVANNLAALGAGRVATLGVLGEDGHGWELRRALAGAGIDASLMVEAPLATFTYTKLINWENGAEDLGRIDFIQAQPLPGAVESEIVARLTAAAASFDVILVSDQAETDQGGVVTAAVRAALAAIAVAPGAPLVWADSRLRAEWFRNALVKPNEREAREACQRVFGRVDYAALRRLIGPRPLFITHAERGVLVVEQDGEQWVPTPAATTPVDICGAGDSFSAGAALALAAGAGHALAARLGNLAASITIMKPGTGTASAEEVRAAARSVGW
jgi:rfaE bifunctional protein kinase chain/domain